MKPKHLYLAGCIAGTVLPYWQFLPFVRKHGLNLRLFFVRPLWAPLAGILAVGVSLGLPLFLSMRERRLERSISA